MNHSLSSVLVRAFLGVCENKGRHAMFKCSVKLVPCVSATFSNVILHCSSIMQCDT